MTGDRMNTLELLDNCIHIERIVGQIYGIFLDQQASCHEFACLWDKTIQEEQNHEQQFLLAKRLACSMKTDLTNVPHPSDELLKKLSDIKLRVAEIPLSTSESISLAINLEEKLFALHLNQIHIFSDESTNTLFISMMKNDKDHIEALQRAFANLL
jgi:rubrerythrin